MWPSDFRDMTSSQFTESIVNEQIPNLKKLLDAGDVEVNNIDVFCERGNFNPLILNTE